MQERSIKYEKKLSAYAYIAISFDLLFKILSLFFGMWKDKKVRKKASQRWDAIDKPYSKASETLTGRNEETLRVFQLLMLQSKKKKKKGKEAFHWPTRT